MALNVSHSSDHRGVIVYNGECILLFTKHVCMSFDDVSSGQSEFKGKKKGMLYLTSHRIIFTNADAKDRLQSFAIPFHCMDRVKLEQPVFGANYLEGLVQAQPDGNWEGSAKFKLTFDHGGCIDFGKALLRAHHMARANATMNAPPPFYAPPMPAGGYYAPPPAYYSPPQAAPYAPFAESRQAFPEQPAPGSVYMYDAPPPYPGIAPMQPQAPYPPQPYAASGVTTGAAYSKEQEAMMSAHNNNANGYATAPQPPEGHAHGKGHFCCR